jgi:hypothetical protein
MQKLPANCSRQPLSQHVTPLAVAPRPRWRRVSRRTELHRKGANGAKIGEDAQWVKGHMDKGFVLCSSGDTGVSFVPLERWTIFTSTPPTSATHRRKNAKTITEVIKNHHILGGYCIDILLLSMPYPARRQYHLRRRHAI